MENNVNVSGETVDISAAPEDDRSTLEELEQLKFKYAKELNREAVVDVCRRIYDHIADAEGPDSEAAFDAKVKLAFAHDKAWHKDKAVEVMNEVHSRKCELFGETAPTTVKTLCARLMLFRVYDDEFENMLDEAYKKMDQIIDVDDNDVMIALYNLAAVMDGYFDNPSVSSYEAIRDWVVKFRGKESREYYAILSELADVYYSADFDEEALEVGEEYYIHCCESYGEESDDALYCYENIAKVHFVMGHHHEAIRHLERLLEVYGRKEGDSVSKLVELNHNMAICQYLAGDTDAARKFSEAAYLLCTNPDYESLLGYIVNDVKDLYTKLGDGGKHGILSLRWRYAWGAMI